MFNAGQVKLCHCFDKNWHGVPHKIELYNWHYCHLSFTYRQKPCPLAEPFKVRPPRVPLSARGPCTPESLSTLPFWHLMVSWGSLSSLIFLWQTHSTCYVPSICSRLYCLFSCFVGWECLLPHLPRPLSAGPLGAVWKSDSTLWLTWTTGLWAGVMGASQAEVLSTLVWSHHCSVHFVMRKTRAR